MEILRFGMTYWKKSLLPSIIAQTMSFIAIIGDLLQPLLAAILVDYVIMGNTSRDNGIFSFLLNGSFGALQSGKLFFWVAAIYVGILLLRGVMIYLKNIWLQHLGLIFETDLRIDTFHKLMELDSQTVSKYHSGELLQTIHSDTIMFKELFCRMIPGMLDSFFLLLVSVVFLSMINVRFLAIPIVIAPLLVITFLKFRKKAHKNFTYIRESNAEMNLKVRENIEAIRLVRSFTNEAYEKEKFDEANEQLKEAPIRQIKLQSIFEVAIGAIRQFGYIATIGISGVLIIQGHMTAGYLVTCSGYMMRIMDHITQINTRMIQMQQMMVSGEKMKSFLNKETEIPDGKKHKETGVHPNISIQNVSLHIEGQPVLHNVNVDIPYGKKLGIVGETGSGKSVLLKLLVRIYDVNSGQILIDGKDIRQYSLKALRHMCSYVFQDVFLFSNTIDSNIAYGVPHAEQKLVEQAAIDAQAHDFISQLPQGYDTIVGERGYGISGGQKQRVSIARALVKQSPVLIFDDSTSALDVQTERKLLHRIWDKYAKHTVIITAHRLSSVVDCDEILYIKDGRIAERGDFRTLMEKNGLFASVYATQQAEQRTNLNYEELRVGEEV